MRLATILMLVVAACSGGPARSTSDTSSPRPVDTAQPWADEPTQCTDERWGGWTGTPECAAAAARVIAAVDRSCATDADCVKMTPANCADNVVSVAAADRYRDWPHPCGSPMGGECMPSRAACVSGCCANVTER